MSKGKYQLIYEIEANDIKEVIAIALESYSRTGLQPTTIKHESASIDWDMQEMVKSITV